MFSIFLAYLFGLFFIAPDWMPKPANAIRQLTEKIEKLLIKRISNFRLAGTILTVLVAGFVWLGVKFILWDFSLLGTVFSWLATVFLLFAALPIKQIKSDIEKIYQLLSENNFDAAREKAAPIINVDAAYQEKDQLIKAVVESAAKSTVETIIGVLFYAFLGGVALAWVYKAIIIVNSHTERNNSHYIGIEWFSLKLEEIFNYLPAWISALVVPLASRICHKDAVRSFRAAVKDSKNHVNTTVAISESAFAGALGIQLGGLNYYQGMPVHKPYLGHACNEPKAEFVKDAADILYVSSAVMAGALLVINFFWNVIL